jgi:hypothetical protein
MKNSMYVLIITTITIIAITSFIYFYSSSYVRYVVIQEICSNPQAFNGLHVRLNGYVVSMSGYMFGPRYMLRSLEDEATIALGGEVDFEPYISFVFYGGNYTEVGNEEVVVTGYVRYQGITTDGPSFYLEAQTLITLP